MSSDLSRTNSAGLVDFCKQVTEREASEWPPTEETLAQEFVKYFGLEMMVFWGIQKLCDTSGIILRVTALPTCLRGFNHRYENKREILISDSQVLTKEHTILHELRELIEYEFCDLNMPTCTREDREERAERFAFSVRLHAFEQEISQCIDQACTIESKWPRRAVYALLILFGAAYAMSLALSPRLENAIEESPKKQQQLRRSA